MAWTRPIRRAGASATTSTPFVRAYVRTPLAELTTTVHTAQAVPPTLTRAHKKMRSECRNASLPSVQLSWPALAPVRIFAVLTDRAQKKKKKAARSRQSRLFFALCRRLSLSSVLKITAIKEGTRSIASLVPYRLVHTLKLSSTTLAGREGINKVCGPLSRRGVKLSTITTRPSPPTSRTTSKRASVCMYERQDTLNLCDATPCEQSRLTTSTFVGSFTVFF